MFDHASMYIIRNVAMTTVMNTSTVCKSTSLEKNRCSNLTNQQEKLQFKRFWLQWSFGPNVKVVDSVLNTAPVIINHEQECFISRQPLGSLQVHRVYPLLINLVKNHVIFTKTEMSLLRVNQGFHPKQTKLNAPMNTWSWQILLGYRPVCVQVPSDLAQTTV